jgi:hypothetical protein
MELHAHLSEIHSEEVTIGVSEDGRLFFEMSCPLCGEQVKQPLKKRASMLQGYEREIGLVAFDLLLHHFQEKHP